MKTAVSIPDTLFYAIEEMARDEGTTRSALYTAALKQMLETKRDDDITAEINRLIEEDGLDTGIDGWMREANRRTAERLARMDAGEDV